MLEDEDWIPDGSDEEAYEYGLDNEEEPQGMASRVMDILMRAAPDGYPSGGFRPEMDINVRKPFSSQEFSSRTLVGKQPLRSSILISFLLPHICFTIVASCRRLLCFSYAS